MSNQPAPGSEPGPPTKGSISRARSASSRSVRILPAVLALSAWASGLAGQLLLDDPRRRFPAFVLLGILAGAGWIGLVRAAADRRAARRISVLTLILALLFRAWALALPPAFSEDVYRYVYEGRVALVGGPGLPFLRAPAEGPALELPPALFDEAWLRINHASIPTIYPPLAQGTFMLAAALGEASGAPTLLLLKLLLVAAELLAYGLLLVMLRRRGEPPTAALYALACPLAILEIAREGHADSLSVLGFAVFCFGFAGARPRLGFVGLALAALGKLNGLVVLPAALRSTRRGLLAALPLFALLALPLALAGTAALTGLGQYAERWRAGDGAFSLLLGMSELLLGGDYVMLGDFALTRHRLARVLSFLAFAGAAVAVLRRPAPLGAAPERAGRLLLLLLLLAPTLHPWYALWLLPFVVYGGPDRAAALTLVALAGLGHHAAWLDLGPGWADLPLVRAAVHLPVWGFLLGPPLLARARGVMLRRSAGGDSWASKKS